MIKANCFQNSPLARPKKTAHKGLLFMCYMIHIQLPQTILLVTYYQNNCTTDNETKSTTMRSVKSQPQYTVTSTWTTHRSDTKLICTGVSNGGKRAPTSHTFLQILNVPTLICQRVQYAFVLCHSVKLHCNVHVNKVPILPSIGSKANNMGMSKHCASTCQHTLYLQGACLLYTSPSPRD